jgi:hypothetical protein
MPRSPSSQLRWVQYSVPLRRRGSCLTWICYSHRGPSGKNSGRNKLNQMKCIWGRCQLHGSPARSDRCRSPVVKESFSSGVIICMMGSFERKPLLYHDLQGGALSYTMTCHRRGCACSKHTNTKLKIPAPPKKGKKAALPTERKTVAAATAAMLTAQSEAEEGP